MTVFNNVAGDECFISSDTLQGWWLEFRLTSTVIMAF